MQRHWSQFQCTTGSSWTQQKSLQCTFPQLTPRPRSVRSFGARHPDIRPGSSVALQTGYDVTTSTGPSRSAERPTVDVTKDVRYRRADFAEVFAFQARQSFAQCLAGGEPSLRLAEAALHAVAEDDALATHSTVQFPVQAYLDRIRSHADEIERRLAVELSQQGAMADSDRALRLVELHLFHVLQYKMPQYGRSNMPRGEVGHPGVYEDARMACLNEVLVRRTGHPAALALLLGDVCRRLFARGALSCPAAVDYKEFRLLPSAVPLTMLTREMLLPGGIPPGTDVDSAVGLNTCTSEVLAEMLRHQKRAYWPFAWDSDSVDGYNQGGNNSHGGFRSAAKLAAGEEMSAMMAAISKVAAWRLERGIWTSPGAGDMQRARAASERLVMLQGDTNPEERRDLAVLLVHCGELGAARAELRAYMDTAAFALADPFDKELCRRVSASLASLGSSVQEPQEVLSVASVMAALPPWEQPQEQQRPKQVLPLTW